MYLDVFGQPEMDLWRRERDSFRALLGNLPGMCHMRGKCLQTKAVSVSQGLVPLTAFYMQYRPFSTIKVAGSSMF
jgi:hypothetical protein